MSIDASATCQNCGRTLRSTARYCPHCGSRLQHGQVIDDQTVAQVTGVLAPSSLPEGELPRGTLLGSQGRYVIERTLGQGGFGAAYLAHDTRLDRPCVVKRLTLNPNWNAHEQALALQSFAREARLLVSLNTPGHPHIPEIYDYLADERCLVMKYIVGQDLDRLRRTTAERLPVEQVLRYIRAVCSALVYMHSRQPEPAIHRDIKPANMLVDAEDRVWLIDFGLAKAMPSAAAVGDGYSTSAGTPGYTPIEQWRGQAEPRSDVYALAATLHRLLTDYVPAQSDILALIRGEQQLPSLRQLMPDLPAELERLVSQGLASVEQRPSASQFLAILDELLNRPSIPAPLPPVQPQLIADLVGRDADLAVYEEQLNRQGVVLISGPAGVGKTVFAGALANQVSDPQRRFWHTFRADESGDSLAWTLASFLAYNGNDELWRGLQNARLSGGQPPPIEQIFDYLVGTLAGQGLLLVFDNLHLIENDATLCDFLSRLLRVARSGELQCMIATRHVPAFAEGFTEGVLAGLDRHSTIALLTAQGVSLPTALLDRLLMLTGGNPQLLLLAADALRRSTNQTQLIERLADSQAIERYLLREVDAVLNDDERELMSGISALLGYPASRSAITETLNRRGLRRELNDLGNRHLLVVEQSEVETLYSQQELVRSFYYEQLGRNERKQLHQRAGVYYEQEDLDLLLAARHYTTAGEHARAAALATKNIWAAVNRGQAGALLRLLEQLMQLALEPQQRIAVCIAAGELQTMLRRSKEAQASFRQALALLVEQPVTDTTGQQRAWACRGLGELLQHEAPQEALEWLHQGLADLAPHHLLEAGALQLRIGSVLIVLGRYTEAIEELKASLSLLPAEAESLRADALTNMGVAACIRGEVAFGKQCYAQALTLYQQANNYWKIITIWQNLGIESWYAGEWNAAAAEYSRALDLARRLGSLMREVQIELALAELLTSQGDFDGALSHLATLHQQAVQQGMPEQAALARLNQAQVYLRLGDHLAAAEALAEAEPAIKAGDFQWVQPPLQRAIAQVALAEGRTAAALAAAEQAVAVAHAQGAGTEEGQSLRIRGEVYVALDQIDAALADFERAIELLERADPYETARTRATLAAALAHHDPARASALREQARAVFERLGAQHDLEGVSG
jgi:serine/threonine protein kinase/tetratricopeptide (TPR) repeat protein